MQVHTITKSTSPKFADHTYCCTKCAEPIKAGQKYYQFQPNRQQPRRSHIEHGPIKQSELCQGKMSAVYAAIESVEAAIAAGRNNSDASSLADALRECAQECEQVKDEYQESFDNMPEPLQQGDVAQGIEEKVNALDEFCSALEDAASECEDWDMSDECPEPGADHDAGCPAVAAEPECDCEQPGGDCTEECAATNHDDTCNCGYDELVQEHDEWETEQQENIDSAFDKAEEVLGELSI